MMSDTQKVYVLTLNIKKGISDTLTYVKGVYSSRKTLRKGVVKVIGDYIDDHSVESDDESTTLDVKMRTAILMGEKVSDVVSHFNALYQDRCYLEVIKTEFL